MNLNCFGSGKTGRIWDNRRLAVGLLLTLIYFPVDLSAQYRRSAQPNRLIHEQSPYLQAHAYNLVDWYPWGDEAFKEAARRKVPVLLSVGFSTCYWCHLMSRDCFSNPRIAGFLNENFVSIKVDREERPDVDQIYASFVEASTGRFGWPMTVFLTPDRKPFFGGGYYEAEPFFDQVKKISAEWKRSRNSVLNSARKLAELLEKLHSSKPDDQIQLSTALLDHSYQWYISAYDRKNGGFGKKSKHTRPDDFNFLLRYHVLTGKRGPLRIVRDTLECMSAGAIHDHLGGGFFRYSIDPAWRHPHTEKLLFFQAQMAISLYEIYQLTEEKGFLETANNVLEYCLEFLLRSDGGFASAEDSVVGQEEGVPQFQQGLFYFWKWDELVEVLQDDLSRFNQFYRLSPDGNIDPNITSNSLYFRDRTLASQGLNSLNVDAQQFIQSCYDRLNARRSSRPRPGFDDKVLTGWNGLMISALSKGFQITGEEKFLEAAKDTVDFLVRKLMNSETGTLCRYYRDGTASVEAFVDDYAFLIQGLIDLYEASLEDRWFLLAIKLQETQLSQFWDEKNGGFFHSAESNNNNFMRMKEIFDIEPSPNAVSAINLLRFSSLMKDQKKKAQVEKLFLAFSHRLEKSSQIPQLKAALSLYLSKKKQILIAGRRDDPLTRRLVNEIHQRFLPNRVILLADGGLLHQKLSQDLDYLSQIKRIGGKTTAYVCEDYLCRMPTSDPEVLGKLLEE